MPEPRRLDEARRRVAEALAGRAKGRALRFARRHDAERWRDDLVGAAYLALVEGLALADMGASEERLVAYLFKGIDGGLRDEMAWLCRAVPPLPAGVETDRLRVRAPAEALDRPRRVELDAGSAALVKARLAAGATTAEVMAEFAISKQMVSALRRGTRWKDVSPAGARENPSPRPAGG